MKLLIVHGYEPSGHASAAAALESAARARGLEVLRVNISADYHPLLGPLIAKSYLGLIDRFPGLWSVMYDNPAVAAVAGQWQSAYLSLGGRKLAARLKEIAPDAVVCTSAPPMAAISLAKAREGFSWPVVAAPTDYRAHAYWLKPLADLYLAASADAADELAERGVPCDRVRVTGIPVHPVFSADLAPQKARAQLGLPDPGPVLLVSGGSRGLGRLGELCQALLAVPEARILVLCGSNELLRDALTVRFRAEPRVKLFAALDPEGVRTVKGACDLLIGRAGGVTAAEAMALGLPLAVFEPIPGQEARNADYLVRQGAAFRIRTLEELPARVTELLKPGALAATWKRARALGKPDSAAKAVDAILSLRP